MVVKVPYIKCNGSGNEFVMIKAQANWTDAQYASFAITTAPKNTLNGVGTDGLLVLGDSDIADASMRMFNTDGSESEMCGNGIRCLGRWYSEQSGKKKFTISVREKVFQMQREPDLRPDTPTYSVLLKNIGTDTSHFPLPNAPKKLLGKPLDFLSEKIKLTALTLPNPHLVAYHEATWDTQELILLGEKIKEDKTNFPQGTNLNFVKQVGDKHIFVATYERGVGLTASCGTGMCASTLAGSMLGILPFGEWIQVSNEGGFVKCRPIIEGDKYHVALLGDAIFEYKGTYHFKA